MIISPNRTHGGGSCANGPRLFSHIKVFARFLQQNARNRTPCPCVIQAQDIGGAAEGASMIGSVSASQGVVPGGFLPRSRDTYKVGPQSRQLADTGNARHIRDQLGPDRPGRDRRFDCRPRDRHQGGLVLSSRTRLGRDPLGPTLALTVRTAQHPRQMLRRLLLSLSFSIFISSVVPGFTLSTTAGFRLAASAFS